METAVFTFAVSYLFIGLLIIPSLRPQALDLDRCEVNAGLAVRGISD